MLDEGECLAAVFRSAGPGPGFISESEASAGWPSCADALRNLFKNRLRGWLMCSECIAALELAEAQRRKIARLQAEVGRLKRRLAEWENGSQAPRKREPAERKTRPSVADRVPVQESKAEYARLIRASHNE